MVACILVFVLSSCLISWISDSCLNWLIVPLVIVVVCWAAEAMNGSNGS